MKNYISNFVTFKPSMWAGLDANGRSTNNGAESFHRHFGDLFGYLRCKPTLPHFIRMVHPYNTHKNFKLRLSRQVHFKCTNVERELALFKSKKISVKTMLSRLSLKNLPKTRPVYKRKR